MTTPLAYPSLSATWDYLPLPAALPAERIIRNAWPYMHDPRPLFPNLAQDKPEFDEELALLIEWSV